MRMKYDIDRKSSSVLRQSLTICQSSLLATGRITYLMQKVNSTPLPFTWSDVSDSRHCRLSDDAIHFVEIGLQLTSCLLRTADHHPHQSSLHQWDDCCLDIHPRNKRPIRFKCLCLHKVFVNRVMQSLGIIERVVPTASEYWYDWLIGDNDLLRHVNNCVPSQSEVSSQSVVTLQLLEKVKASSAEDFQL